MNIKQSVRLLSIGFVLFFSGGLFLHLFKLHYAWEAFVNIRQFKICVVLALGTQLSLFFACLIGAVGAPGLYLFKRWGRHLICGAMILKIAAILFKSAARFWPNLMCNYVNESIAPYMEAKEAFVYKYILYFPSPMVTMLTFMATAGLLYFFTRRSCQKLFAA